MKLRMGLGIALLFAGCTAIDAEPDEKVLLVRNPLKVARPTRTTGESCAQNGGSECIGGVCIHTSAKLDADYFCTTPCRVTADCAESFTCGRIPGTYSSYCIPPPGWTAKVATARVRPNR